MPEQEKTDTTTPADRRRKRRSGILVFCLFLTVVLAGMVSAVLAVNDGRNYKRLVRHAGLEAYLLPAPPPPPLVIVGGQKRRPWNGAYPPRLLTSYVQSETLFEKNETLDADDRCDLLQTEQGTKAAFTVAANDWECLLFQEFKANPLLPSYFIQARGKNPDDLVTFRVKLNMTDPATEQAIIGGTLAAIDRFGLQLSPDTRTYLKERLASRTEFNSYLENYRMKFDHERGDDRRYNLLIVPLPKSTECAPPLATQPNAGEAQTYPMPLGCLAIRPVPAPIRTES